MKLIYKALALTLILILALHTIIVISEYKMGKWAKVPTELLQIITPDGTTFDLTSESKKGNWVIEASGFGMPDIDYISQQGPFQHGESIRDYRLKPRIVQLILRQQACDRDSYWDRRTELLNALRPNRDLIDTEGSWAARSQALLESQVTIYSLEVFDNELYGGTGNSGKLFKWDGQTQWVEVADQAQGQIIIYSLIVYDDGGGDDLYGGTGIGGRLFRFGGSSWTQVAAQLNGQATIYAMAEFDDGLGGGSQIFAGTGAGGRLFHYNVGGAAWAQDCAQLNAETAIKSLIVFDDGGGDDLYGGTSPNGKLYRYNPAGGAWVEVCAQLNAQTSINSLCEYKGNLYGCTEPNGRLFQYDVAGGNWTQVAAQYGDITYLYSLVVYQGRLYGAGYNGYLLRWNDTDAWEFAANPYGQAAWNTVVSTKVFNNRLFAGTTNQSVLTEYIQRLAGIEAPCTVLRRYLSDGSIRDLCCYIDKGPQFSKTVNGWDEHSFQEVVRLYAPNPILYDPTEQDGPTYTMDPAATGIVNETQTVTYGGTWEEYPTIVITGPIENPIIRNEDTDEFIEFDYDISAGEVVTLTLTFGNKTVENDTEQNLIRHITPESNLDTFHLAADPEVTDGENDITISGTGTNAATYFSFTYYNRYIGI